MPSRSLLSETKEHKDDRRKVESLVEKESIGGKMAKGRKSKKSRLDDIMKQIRGK